MKGNTASVTLDGQAVLGFVYNALTVDGEYGLFAQGGAAKFDNVTMMTNDMAYIGTNANTPPTASDDAVGTAKNTPLVINGAMLLANDSDLNGDVLTISAFVQPAHGVIIANANNTYTYTPSVGFVGIDSFAYTIDDGHGGTSSAIVHVTVSGPVTKTFSTSPNLALRDFATTTSQIVVSGAVSATVRDINVRISINHTRSADLDVFLISPTGVRIELFTDVGLGKDFVNTTLDDEAAISILNGANPFTGVFRPESSLAGFDGLAVNGTWTLEIIDDTRKEIGTLVSWSLVIEYLDSGQNLVTPASSSQSTISGSVLTVDELAPLVQEAIARWTASGVVTDSALAALKALTFEVSDLYGTALGTFIGNVVYIDIDGAGYGWFIDDSPADDKEFTTGADGVSLVAVAGSEADRRMDLFSVLMHEIGHALGFDHDVSPDGEVMDEILDVGTRLMVSEAESVTTSQVNSISTSVSVTIVGAQHIADAAQIAPASVTRHAVLGIADAVRASAITSEVDIRGEASPATVRTQSRVALIDTVVESTITPQLLHADDTDAGGFADRDHRIGQTLTVPAPQSSSAFDHYVAPALLRNNPGIVPRPDNAWPQDWPLPPRSDKITAPMQ